MLQVEIIESSALGGLNSAKEIMSRVTGSFQEGVSPVELTSEAEAKERFAKVSIAGFLINLVANIICKEEEKRRMMC